MSETVAKAGCGPRPGRWDQTRKLLPGIIMCIAVAAVAGWLGQRATLFGGAVIAILLGIVVGNVTGVTAREKPGISFCSKKVLQASIIVLGGGVSFSQVMDVGGQSVVVMLSTLAAALLVAYGVGRLLQVPRNLMRLIGVGTGICGGSAIAAVAPIVEADDDEIAFSISTVFLFNVIAVVLFPALGHLMQMSDSGFGIWAGTAVNDTSAVVASAYSYSQAAGDYATITKLARTTMIVPVALAFALLLAGGRRAEGEPLAAGVVRVFPWFVLGFAAMAMLNTFGAWDAAVAKVFSTVGKDYLMVLALAGVGLGTDLRKIMSTGFRPVLLGLAVWAAVALTSLAVQAVTRML